MEGNVFEKIQGFESCTKIRSLYLQENCIKKIENLDCLKELVCLNLSENWIETIENLDKLPCLQTLIISKNRIGRKGKSDIEHCVQLQTLTVLDIQDNKIEDPAAYEVFKNIPQIGVLYAQNNPFITKIDNFRKIIVNDVKSLKYLNDRPIFEEDRRFAEAFCRGGIQEERAERRRWNQEQDEKRRRYHEDFNRMVNAWREEAKQNQQQNPPNQQIIQNQLNLEHLEINSQNSTDCSIENKPVEQSTSPTNSSLSFHFEQDQSVELQQRIEEEQKQEIIEVHIQRKEEQQDEDQSSLSNMLKIQPQAQAQEKKEEVKSTQQVQRVLIEEMPNDEEQVLNLEQDLQEYQDQLESNIPSQKQEEQKSYIVEDVSLPEVTQNQKEELEQNIEKQEQECIDLDELD